MKVSGQQTPNMNIPSSGAGSRDNGNTSNIEKQIQSLQEEISNLDKNNSLSPKGKQEKRKQLEEEINTLKQQLAQEQIEQKKNEKVNGNKNSAPQTYAKNEKDKEGMSNTEMNAILSASVSMKQAKAINGVRVHMNGDAHALKGEIAMIESKGGDPIEQKQKLSELETKIGNVTGSLVEKYGEANKSIKTVSPKSEKNTDEEGTQTEGGADTPDKTDAEEKKTEINVLI